MPPSKAAAKINKPAEIVHPFQDYIWSQILTDRERFQYKEVSRKALGNAGRKVPCIHAWYRAQHVYAPINPNLPPPDPQWRPEPNRVIEPAQPSSPWDIPVHILPTVRATTVSTTQDILPPVALRPQKVRTLNIFSTPPPQAPCPQRPNIRVPLTSLSLPSPSPPLNHRASSPPIRPSRIPRPLQSSQSPQSFQPLKPSQPSKTSRPHKRSRPQQPALPAPQILRYTPWARPVGHVPAPYVPPDKAPTMSPLSDAEPSAEDLWNALSLPIPQNLDDFQIRLDDDSAPSSPASTQPSIGHLDFGNLRLDPPPISVPRLAIIGSQANVRPGILTHGSHTILDNDDTLPQSPAYAPSPSASRPGSPDGPARQSSSPLPFGLVPTFDEVDRPATPTQPERGDSSESSPESDTESSAESSPHTSPIPGRSQRPRLNLADVSEILPTDVHAVLQTVTAFHCDCPAGAQHDLDAGDHLFSLPELRRASGPSRCFPPPDKQWPRPFHGSHPALKAADFDQIDYAQYLSTLPTEDHPRRKLRLRSTTTFPQPLEDSFYVTWDVDSVWLRLNELSDLIVPIELAYTAQRGLNIKGSQHIPRFSSDDDSDFEIHRTAHSLFAKTTFSSCTARVYVFWPLMKKHNRTVIKDEDFALWTDGVVVPAVKRLASCAWQDHPKSWEDARTRSQHRGEVGVGGAQGAAGVEYTLSARFLAPLVEAMREITGQLGEDSPLFPFRSFSFVMIVHDLKRAFNAEIPGFEAITQFEQTLTTTFRPEYLQSATCLDRSFADTGIEYNLKATVTEPTTLLIRRTCIEHRFSTALLTTNPMITQGISAPQLFTTYSLHDAATARIFIPNRAPISAVLPMIKGYNLHKHTCHTHFRHEHASPFTLPHLDLLCLTESLLRDMVVLSV